MSIKRKVATALTTAGLLAGIFGSTLAPVAQGATTTLNAALISAEFHGNLSGDEQDLQGSANDGSTSYPAVLYSPIFNDGSSNGGEIMNAACTYVDADDIETLAEVDLLDSDDITASITATGGVIVDGLDDDATMSFSSDEDDYAATYTDNNVVTGIAACFTVNDDDLSSKTLQTAVLKVNGQTVATLNFKVVGPGQTLTLTDNTGGWVAMDNETVYNAFSIKYLDASGNDLFTSLRDASTDTSDGLDTEELIEGYWKDGYDAEGSDIRFATDVAGTGDDFEVIDAVDFGDTDGKDLNNLDLYDSSSDSICDSDRDADFGASHNVWVIMDLGSGGEVSSGDTKSNSVAVKCSAWGDEALVTGIDFGTTTSVELGGVVPFYVRIQDGYGNPLGVGTTDDLEFGFQDVADCEYYDSVDDDCFALLPTPNHYISDGGGDYYGYMALDGASTEVEDYDDGDTTCNGARGYEADYTLEGGDNLDDELNAAGSDKVAAGVVLMCYYASTRLEDLGRNTLKVNMSYPYTDTLAVDYGAGNSPVSYTAGITLVRESGVNAQPFGTAVKVGKKTVSITGPVGAKIAFVVEDSAGNVKTYARIVEAKDGKAKFVFKKRGTFDVYAIYGEQITGISRIAVKL